MTQQFTASEVRKNGDELFAHNAAITRSMLHAYADMLEAQEKAVPVAVVKDSDALYTGYLSWTGESVPPETKLYTHPAPSDAERLEEQRDDAFLRAVQEARRVWMDEFPCESGHDHVTPFDQFLYGKMQSWMTTRGTKR